MHAVPLRTSPARAAFVPRATLERSSERDRLVDRAVERAKEGDRDAVRFLYVQFANNVYGYVRSIVHDSHEAEDITQHVFAKLITCIGHYDRRGVPFFAWLLRLAHNAAIDYLRSRRVTPTDEVYGADARSDDSGQARAWSLHDALAALPREQRNVVVLRHVVGLSPAEIAECLGRTESAVHGLHHRGRRALCAELRRQRSGPSTTAALQVA